MTDSKPANFSSSAGRFGSRTPCALLSALAVILLLTVTSQQADAQVLLVGSNSSGQTTNFTSGTNTFTYAYIGATTNDSNNTLNVLNLGTVLTIVTGNIQVGYGGNNNSMVISNGGFVSDVTGVVSFGTGSNNSVLVTGAGSTWSNSTQVRLGVSGQGSLTVANEGSVIVTGANGIQAAVNAGSVGVLNIGSYGGNDSAGSIIAPKIAFGSGTGTLNFNQTNTFTLTNAITGLNTIVFQQLGSGTTILTGANSSANSTLISQGTLQIGDGGVNGSFGSRAITNNSVLAINSASTITLSQNQSITGTGALIQMGSGTTILNATNTTYSGGTLISSGTLQVGAGALGSLYDTNGSLGTGNVTNNETLAFSRRNASDTVSNNISGTGALAIVGSSEGLTLAGSNSYSGLTTITTGNSLQIGTGSTNGTLGSGSVSNAGKLNINRSDLYTASNAISGSGALSQIGSGTTILNGSNSYSGTTTISSGTLLFQNASSLYGGSNALWTAANIIVSSNTTAAFAVGGTGGFTTSNVTTLLGNLTAVNNNGLKAGSAIGFDTTAGAFILTNAIGNSTGSGGGRLRLIKLGTDTLTLSGSNSYSGGTTISAGSVAFTSSSAFGSGAVSLSGGGALAYTGNGAATLTNNISVDSGTGIIGNTGSSILTLGGTLTHSGSMLEFYGGSYSVTGKITGSATNSDLLLSNAAVTLSNIGNDCNGFTKVLAGSTLTAGVNDALTAGSSLTVGGAGDSSSLTNSYNMNGNNQTLGALSSGGSALNQVQNSSGTASLLTIAGTSSFGGVIIGNLGLTLTNSTVTLSGSNSYTGSTTLYNSSLSLTNTGYLSRTANVLVGSGSTFLLGGSNQVNTNAALTLAGGQLSLGAAAPGSRAESQTFASLTLTADSVINFANLTGTSSLTFGTISLGSNNLTVQNWSGTNQWGTTSAGALTHLYDTTDTSGSLATGSLSQISFYGTAGQFLGTGAFSNNEIVPVPEPSVIIAGLLLLGSLAYCFRNREQ